MDFIQYIASTGAAMAFPPPCPFLASPTSPSPALGRYFSVDKGARGAPVGPCPAQSPIGSQGSAFPALCAEQTGSQFPLVPLLFLEAGPLGPPLQQGLWAGGGEQGETG